MKKWIEVNGKMMDAVEFTRFIRKETADETEIFVREVIEKEHKNNLRLKKLQQQDA
ncbi:MAG: hypothetical protein HZB66_02930 [Candidatus Aenigmarchaeota archaeon]|nr:hypothetical protein [Candidatus Aenigmarchaeota archaeon]